jgi:purine catabolism regulator
MQIFPFQTMSGKKAALIMNSASQAVLPVSKNILDQAVTPLHLWFRIDQQSRNFQEEKAKFFCKLIEGKWRSSEEIDRWASRYGLTASLKYALVTGMPETDLDHSQQYLVKNRVEDIIRICSSKIGVKYFCTFHDELLIIILEMKENIQKNISRLLDLLDQRLMDAEFPVHFWGIDDHLSEVLKIPALYQRAKTALEIGLTHKRLGRRITYSDTAVYRLLDAFAKNETANELIQNTLGNLTAYQQEHHLDLLRTLKCYINCKGNVSQTARTLSLQRQSLMYRLQKIESLSCRSLSNPDDLFIFQLSVKLMDV